METKDNIIGNIPGNWEIKQILDEAIVVTDYVANGSFASLASNVKYLEGDGYAILIRVKDFNNGFKGNYVYIDEHAYKFLAKSKLEGGEIIISNVGNVGTVFKCPKLSKKMSLAPNSIMVKFKGIDDFYYYWFTSPKGQAMLQSIVTGSAQPKFNKTNFKELYIPVPPINIQRKIASILGSFDSKIELNNRMNENLLNQLFALFDNTFGTQKPSRKTCKAEDYFDITIGKTPPRKEQECFTKKTEDIKWVSISDMGSCGIYINKSSEYLTQSAVEKYNVKVVPENTVLLSFKLTVGRVVITDCPIATNEAIAHFKTENTKINPYLYCYLKKFNYRTMGSTSSIATAVNSKIIKAMPFVIPTDDELKAFNEFAIPTFNKIRENEHENEKLASIRDTLLPKLMSGEIDVTDLDI